MTMIFKTVTVISSILLINLISSHGSPISDAVEDYPNDYYNDEEYYGDDYDTNNNESNEIFDASGNKETIIQRNPKFLSQPKKILVNEGDTIKLPCMVDKMDNFVIIWKKGSKILAVGDKFMESDARAKIETSEHGNVLVYSLADAEDSGDYTCQVSALNTIELKHTVKVRVRPEIQAKETRITVEAGQPAELKCIVTRGSPDPEIIWRRQSRPFVGGQETLPGESLTFPHTTRHHSGLYTCSADNGWGTPATAQIHVDVLHKPEIEQEETFIHSKDGDEVEVVCIVHSSPVATVEWYRNGQLLDPRTSVINVRGNRHTLLVTNIGENEVHGKYDCRAYNSYGEAMATTEVSGKAAPANFKSSPMSDDEREYTLEWVVSSSSLVTEFSVEYRMSEGAGTDWIPLQAEVYKVGEESFAGKVSLHKLAPATSYMARVAAKNSYGYSTFSPNFHFSTFNKYFKEEELDSGEPKHEKSVSGAEGHVLSTCVALLITAPLLMLFR